MAIPEDLQVEVRAGQLGLNTSEQQVVDGLSATRYIRVKPWSTNQGDVILGTKAGFDRGDAGYLMEAADDPILWDINYDLTQLWAKSSTAQGTTISYAGVGVR